ncbi:hypothetical protein BpHYR1_016613 [Brachionus plicatilis]|uniref:Uncharacterized protein n=1 Tax=Brachionus plicatilis TaxID=10195 RepID=A0A3M7SKL0_BRAPC|nr:hypothetical protein BpHYR1_016613 [Brachionus plicatilis]
MLGPDYFAAAVHGNGGLLAAQLDHHAALVVPDGHVVRAFQTADGPDPLQAVVQRVVQSVGVGVPELDGAVLGAGQYQWQLGRKVCVRRAQLPHFDCLVQAGAGKCVVVLGIEDYLHDVIKNKIKKQKHTTAGQNKRLSWMDCDASDIV